MNHPLLITLLLAAPLVCDAAAVSKNNLLDRIEQVCTKNSLAEGKLQALTCTCLRANYEKRLDIPALENLAKLHEGTLPKEEMTQSEEILDFDMLAAEKCIENPSWRWQEEKIEKPLSNKAVAPHKTSPKPQKAQ